MKLKYILLHLIMIVFAAAQLSAQNTNPVVSNVAFSISGTTVTVTYDVSDAEQSSVTIMMEVSNDDGTTWDYNYGATSGDIGAGVSTGTNKTITWEYSDGSAENFKIKIIADDLVGDQIYYAGKIYNTVTIGSQVWLKENLDVGDMINSTNGGTNSDGEQTNNSIIEKYCYGDNTANCDTYGGLYQLDEAMQYSTTPGAQGICPSGWHLPTLAELQTLGDAVGGSGNALKSVGQGSGGGAGTNTSGFSALLAGIRNTTGSFTDLVTGAFFWSSTEVFSVNSEAMLLFNGNDNITFGPDEKVFGLSMRCLKD